MSPNKKTKASRPTHTGSEAALVQLSRKCGIQPIYRNEAGQLQIVPEDSLKEILELMGIPHAKLCQSQKGPKNLIREKNLESWTEMVPKTMVVPRSSLSTGWMLSLPIKRSALADLSLHWMINPDKGQSARGQFANSKLQFLQTKRIGGASYVQFVVPFPPGLAIGYYSFQVEA